MGIAVDSAGNIYITGQTNSVGLPHHPRRLPDNQRSPGGKDGFLTKFDSSGNLVYSTYLGGSDADYGHGIAVDSTGNICITG